MLRQFHYIDQNGKDQGINVRNRSAELGKLLGDVDQIRAERKKARSNKNKYGGVEGGAGIGGGFSGGSSRYGGFGSETGGFGGGYGGEVYGDGGGFGGEDPELRYQNTQRRGDDFEEYDAGDDEESSAPAPQRTATTSSTSQVKRASQPAQPKQKAPEQDLFDFGDEPISAPTITSASSRAAAPNPMDDFGALQGSAAGADDDFDDFQSATSPAPAQANVNPLAAFSPPPTTSTTTSATYFAAPQPIAPTSANTILSAPSPAPSATSSVAPSTAFASPPAQQSKPLQPTGGFKPSGPNYFTSVRADINAASTTSTSAFSARTPSTTTTPQQSYGSSTTMATLGKPTAKAAAPAKAGGDAFGSIWNNASSKAGVQQKAAPAKGPGMAAMQKEKSSAGIWGAASNSTPPPRTGAQNPPLSAQAQSPKPQQSLGHGLDDLLG